MNQNLLDDFLQKLPSIRTLVVGDLILDEYVWGSTERISPEAPVPIVDIHRENLRLGGAGNVITNLLALGCKVKVASVIGDDENASLLQQRLDYRELSAEGVISQPGRVTSRKTRVISNNQQILRIDQESREAINADSEMRLISFIEEVSAHSDVILISDYQKGVLTDSVLRKTIELGKQAGIPVVVDPKGNDFRKYRGATLLTPNKKELRVATGETLQTEEEIVQVGFRVRAELELESLVLTRSEEGISLFSGDGKPVRLEAQAREVFDVTGAGDTVLSMIGVGLAGGLSLENAARLANVAAGIVVGNIGASTVSPLDLLSAFGKHSGPDQKVMGVTALADHLDVLRGQGKRIVFTNGCFDLLHVGHVKYLQKARQLGDVLVLGLNSDDSIRRLKGENRPLICEDERAHILAALGCIDHVVIFDDDTPIELIKSIKPDVLAKGEDYVIEDVVGRDVVESYGGRVELV
ncbi:MAG: bifunctional heptose 7-phosphate kinase/heptose 1-phosphate adenyltransferase, partial [Desulfuromonas sp.]